MPASAGKLLEILAIPKDKRDFKQLGRRRIKAGAQLPAPAPVFPRYVEPEAVAKANA
jgi:methionyl-tRNA synthetase